MQRDHRVFFVVLVASSLGSALFGGSALCVQEAMLTPVPPVANQLFGWSACVDGDTAIFGAPCNTAGGLTNPGSAYIFVRSGGVWTQQAQVTAPGSVPGDEYGYSVSLDGDTAIMGSYDAGSACIFVREGTDWTLQAQLRAPDGISEFGYSVAIDGNTAVIGAPNDGYAPGAKPGAAFVFVRSGIHWTQQAYLTAPKVDGGDNFGWSVVIEDDRVVIGAPITDVGTIDRAGAAYIFVREDNAWALEAQMVAFEPETQELFGDAIALDGNTVLIGAHHYDIYGDGGSAYVFVSEGTAWTQQAHILNPNPDHDYGSQYFGYGVSVFGDLAVISAPVDGIYGDPTVYTFRRCAGEWSQLSQLDDVYGNSVFYDGETVFVGDVHAVPSLAGSVRVYSCPEGPPCPADFTDDGQVSLIDTAYVLGYWSLGLPDGDINCDGIVNGFDLAESLAAWGPCPN